MKWEIKHKAPLTVPITDEQIVNTVARHGFDMSTVAVGDRPRIPVDLVDHPPAELGTLLGRLTAYADHVNRAQTISSIKAGNLKELLDNAYAQAYLNHPTGSVDDRKHLARTDEQVLALREQWLSAKTEATLLKTMLVDSIARDMKTVSRLISVKEQEINMGVRDHNVSRLTEDQMMARIKGGR